MTLTWYNKMLCGAALLTLLACGGSGSSKISSDDWKPFPLHLVNNAGAQATFTWHMSTGGLDSKIVGAGATADVTGYGDFPQNATSGTFFTSVVGNGSEMDGRTVTIGTTEVVHKVTATWNDVTLSLSKS